MKRPFLGSVAPEESLLCLGERITGNSRSVQSGESSRRRRRRGHGLRESRQPAREEQLAGPGGGCGGRRGPAGQLRVVHKSCQEGWEPLALILPYPRSRDQLSRAGCLPVSHRGPLLSGALDKSLKLLLLPRSAESPLGFPPALGSSSLPVRSGSPVAVKPGADSVSAARAKILRRTWGSVREPSTAADQRRVLRWPQKPMRSKRQSQLPIPDIDRGRFLLRPRDDPGTRQAHPGSEDRALAEPPGKVRTLDSGTGFPTPPTPSCCGERSRSRGPSRGPSLLRSGIRPAGPQASGDRPQFSPRPNLRKLLWTRAQRWQQGQNSLLRSPTRSSYPAAAAGNHPAAPKASPAASLAR